MVCDWIDVCYLSVWLFLVPSCIHLGDLGDHFFGSINFIIYIYIYKDYFSYISSLIEPVTGELDSKLVALPVWTVERKCVKNTRVV